MTPRPRFASPSPADAGEQPARGARFLATLIVLALLVISIGAILLLATPPVSAQPAFVNSWSGGSATATNTITVTIATTAGHTILVTTAVKLSATHVSTIWTNAAGGSDTFTSKVGPVANTVGFEIWGTSVGASKSATSIIVNFTDSSSKLAVAIADYNLVTNYGNTNGACTGSGANPGPCAVTVQDANGAIVGGFASNDGTSQTALTGNLRQAPVATGGAGSTRVGDSLVDLLLQTAGSHSIQTTHAAIAWAGGAIELRNQTPCTVAPTATLNNGQTALTWTPAKATEGPDAAAGQGATSALTVTNNGPGNCNIQVSNASVPSGVEYQWATSNSYPGAGVHDITGTPATVCASIATGATCNIWFWSTFTNAAAGTFTPNTIITEA